MIDKESLLRCDLLHLVQTVKSGVSGFMTCSIPRLLSSPMSRLFLLSISKLSLCMSYFGLEKNNIGLPKNEYMA